MIHLNQLTPGKNIPWFQQWFDSAHYHKLYANRNDREAEAFINELIYYLQPKSNSFIMDVGCGNGRHCRQLASKGFNVMGIDLALSSILKAKKWEIESLQFLRHDMRIPFGSNQFDYVFNFFTSFGYFKTDAENDKVICNMSNALKKNGTLVLDYMNVHYVGNHLVPSEEIEIDGIIYRITRWMDEKFFYKKIVIDEMQTGEPFENVEQVARFSQNDFERMFGVNDMIIQDAFGDYQLNEFDINSSARFIAVVKKS
jgi:SAM-dependent methyltransferase